MPTQKDKNLQGNCINQEQQHQQTYHTQISTETTSTLLLSSLESDCSTSSSSASNFDRHKQQKSSSSLTPSASSSQSFGHTLVNNNNNNNTDQFYNGNTHHQTLGETNTKTLKNNDDFNPSSQQQQQLDFNESSKSLMSYSVDSPQLNDQCACDDNSYQDPQQQINMRLEKKLINVTLNQCLQRLNVRDDTNGARYLQENNLNMVSLANHREHINNNDDEDDDDNHVEQRHLLHNNNNHISNDNNNNINNNHADDTLADPNDDDIANLKASIEHVKHDANVIGSDSNNIIGSHLQQRANSIVHFEGFTYPPTTTTTITTTYNNHNSNLTNIDAINNNILSHNQRTSEIHQSIPATVAGVGGTITTVTAGSTKTAPLPRLVGKNGAVNLNIDNIDRRQYFRDLFTTMIDIKWRYNLLAASLGFVFSWIFFAAIWYIVLYIHDDLSHDNDPNWKPCIVNVHSFSAALLFSIETQSTLGFGSRIISVECPGAIIIFCSQLIFGVVVECLIVGMVFAKLSRPAKRSQTIMFSKYATVCLRDDQMCLTFRVGDVRSKSHIIGATIRASLVSQKLTNEGEIIPFYHHQLDVKIDDARNNLLLIWPLTIVHIIDRDSLFYEMNSEQLANFKFEIITVIEGTVESTGQSIQVRTSYLPSEVKWGYRFEPIISTQGYGPYAQTIIDYNKFNRILPVETPMCSAKDYERFRVKMK